MIKIINGNILKSDADIIVQQVNCVNVMGGGLAKQIAARYPEVKKEYHEFCKGKPSSSLLGLVQLVDTYDKKIIANVFGQEFIRKGYRDKVVYTSTDSLIKGLSKIKEYATGGGLTVAIPYGIGCGMANGDWSEIKPLIDELFTGMENQVSYYKYGG